MSDLREQYKRFLRLEDDLRLFDRSVGQIKYWELARVEVFLTLFERRVRGGSKRASKSKGPEKLLFYIKSLFDFKKNPYLCPKKGVIFSGGQRRVLTEDGFWWDIHVDPIIDYLDLPYMSLEYPIDLEHYGPPRTENLYHFDLLLTLGFLRSKLGLTKIRIPQDEIEFLSRVRSEIERRLGFDIDIPKIVTNRIHEHRALLPLCLRLLKHIEPRLVVMVTSYARKSLLEACKRLRIPAVELQHGVISPYHPGYSFPEAARGKTCFPDYLLVFGEYWRDIANYPIDNDRIISVGYPYLERKIEQYAQQRRKKQIVFISQGRIGVPISKFAVELSRVPDLDYKIVYKLHPRETAGWKNRYPWLLNTDIEVIDTLGTDLYRLLGESMVQVGVSSTAIYEGIAYGLETYLLDVLGVEYFDPLIRTKLVHKVSSAEEMIELLKSSDVGESVNSEMLFLPNGVEHTVAFLRDLYARSSDESTDSPF